MQKLPIGLQIASTAGGILIGIIPMSHDLKLGLIVLLAVIFLASSYWGLQTWILDQKKAKRQLFIAFIMGALILSPLLFFSFTQNNSLEKSTKLTTSSPTPTPTTEIIANKKFFNTEIKVDYKEYVNCEFTNITILYNGGPAVITGCTFNGYPALNTEDPKVQAGEIFMLTLLKMSGGLKRNNIVQFPNNPELEKNGENNLRR